MVSCRYLTSNGERASRRRDLRRPPPCDSLPPFWGLHAFGRRRRNREHGSAQHGPVRMTRIDLPLQPNGTKVQWSYLPRQFNQQSIEDILGRVRAFVPTGDFTLGKPVREFEE